MSVKLFLKTQYEWDIPKVKPYIFSIDITQVYIFYHNKTGVICRKELNKDNIFLKPFPYSNKISKYKTWIMSEIIYPNVNRVEILEDTRLIRHNPLKEKTLIHLPPKLSLNVDWWRFL